jgi:hypothetical protein
MEIKKMKPTAEVAYQLKVPEGEKPQTLKLTVKYFSDDQGVDIVENGKPQKASDLLRGVIAESVIAWDLTDNGVAVPVNVDTLKEFVPQIAAAMTVEGDVIGLNLFTYIRNQKNFLKN